LSLSIFTGHADDIYANTLQIDHFFDYLFYMLAFFPGWIYGWQICIYILPRVPKKNQKEKQ